MYLRAYAVTFGSRVHVSDTSTATAACQCWVRGSGTVFRSHVARLDAVIGRGKRQARLFTAFLSGGVFVSIRFGFYD